MSAVKFEWRPCVSMTRWRFLWRCEIVGGFHKSSVVRFWMVRPGVSWTGISVFASLRAAYFEFTRDIVYEIGALAKTACEAISIIHVRLDSASQLEG